MPQWDKALSALPSKHPPEIAQCHACVVPPHNFKTLQTHPQRMWKHIYIYISLLISSNRLKFFIGLDQKRKCHPLPSNDQTRGTGSMSQPPVALLCSSPWWGLENRFPSAGCTGPWHTHPQFGLISASLKKKTKENKKKPPPDFAVTNSNATFLSSEENKKPTPTPKWVHEQGNRGRQKKGKWTKTCCVNVKRHRGLTFLQNAVKSRRTMLGGGGLKLSPPFHCAVFSQ